MPQIIGELNSIKKIGAFELQKKSQTKVENYPQT